MSENLLSNALKFSPLNNNIILRIIYPQVSDINRANTPQVIIKVIDEEIAIDQQLHPKIFEPYNTGE